MTNRLSELAAFLDKDSLPAWLKRQIQEKASEISAALDHGQSYTLVGPNGESVKISPKAVVAA